MTIGNHALVNLVNLQMVPNISYYIRMTNFRTKNHTDHKIDLLFTHVDILMISTEPAIYL